MKKCMHVCVCMDEHILPSMHNAVRPKLPIIISNERIYDVNYTSLSTFTVDLKFKLES